MDHRGGANHNLHMLAAASKKSGITNLRQIKDRYASHSAIVGGNDIIF